MQVCFPKARSSFSDAQICEALVNCVSGDHSHTSYLLNVNPRKASLIGDGNQKKNLSPRNSVFRLLLDL